MSETLIKICIASSGKTVTDRGMVTMDSFRELSSGTIAGTLPRIRLVHSHDTD